MEPKFGPIPFTLNGEFFDFSAEAVGIPFQWMPTAIPGHGMLFIPPAALVNAPKLTDIMRNRLGFDPNHVQWVSDRGCAYLTEEPPGLPLVVRVASRLHYFTHQMGNGGGLSSRGARVIDEREIEVALCCLMSQKSAIDTLRRFLDGHFPNMTEMIGEFDPLDTRYSRIIVRLKDQTTGPPA